LLLIQTLPETGELIPAGIDLGGRRDELERGVEPVFADRGLRLRQDLGEARLPLETLLLGALIVFDLLKRGAQLGQCRRNLRM